MLPSRRICDWYEPSYTGMTHVEACEAQARSKGGEKAGGGEADTGGREAGGGEAVGEAVVEASGGEAGSGGKAPDTGVIHLKARE
eukprot:1161503-Pelagomonas_calceolata.AAC.2